jgi:hypothetical protein
MNENWDENHARYQRRMRALLVLMLLVMTSVVGLLGAHALIVGEGTLLFDLWSNAFVTFSAAAMFSGVAFPAMMLLFAFVALPIALVFWVLSRGKRKP